MTKRLSTALRSRPFAGVGVCSTIALSLALAVPALAQTTTTPATTPGSTAAPAAPMASPAIAPSPAPVVTTPDAAAPGSADAGGPISQAQLQSALGHEKSAKIEAHITKLRADLKITPAQDASWQAFAGTMRSNAVQMDSAYSRRQENYAGMNAVQDLQSYGEVEQTNARNIAQLLPPFQALYAALSPQQQKIADGIFVRHIDKAVKKPG